MAGTPAATPWTSVWGSSSRTTTMAARMMTWQGLAWEDVLPELKMADSLEELEMIVEQLDALVEKLFIEAAGPSVTKLVIPR